MSDPRYDKLAEVLTRHSTALKPGDKVLIEVSDVPDGMVIALIRAVRKAKALPFTQLQHSRVSRELAMGATGEQIAVAAEAELSRMKKMDAFIAIRGSDNATEMSDVPQDKLKMIAATMRPVMNHRINKTRWVVLRWPSPSMAQQAQMSTEAFEDYYFRVCTVDYGKLRKGMEALKALMDATDKVHIKGPDTDLRFSIKDIGSVICGGDRNIPDGEVFTAPVKRSVEGKVRFNVPSIYHGTAFEDVALEFKQGRITGASAGRNTAKLNTILDAANFPSASTRTSCIPSATFSSTKKSPVPSTLRRARLTKWAATATAAKSTGTWSASNAPITAAARFGSTESSSGKMDSSPFRS
jgi:aminopeptidase